MKILPDSNTLAYFRQNVDSALTEGLKHWPLVSVTFFVGDRPTWCQS
jgi:hypothetical protein